MKCDVEFLYQKEQGFFAKPIEATPQIGRSDLLIKTRYVGICGSDLYYMAIQNNPLRLGHEWVGEILQVGSEVSNFKIGDMVTGSGHFACGLCSMCLNDKSNLCSQGQHMSSEKIGALRSHFIAPANQIQLLEGTLSKAQVLHEVFAVGEQAYLLLKNQIKENSHCKIIVFGAGPIGLSVALVLRSYNLDVLMVEKNPKRVQRAQNLELQAITLGEALLRSDLKGEFEILIDASNDYSGDSGAFKLLTYFAKKEFQALIVGKYIQQQIFSTTLNSMAGTFQWMRGVSNKTMEQSLLKWNSKLEKLGPEFISHVYPIERIQDAFEMAKNKSESCKVVIEL